MDYKTHLWEHGYAVLRSAYSAADVAAIAEEMDRLKAEALRHDASYRDRNLVYVIRRHPILGRHLRFIHWAAYISPVLARYRIDLRQLALLEPLIGNNLKQIANQVTWKTPETEDTIFGFHQDARFRRPVNAFRELATSYIQTLLAIDPHRVENGCLKIYPGSHKHGILELPVDRSVMDMESENVALKRCGLEPDRVVNILLDPGDVVLWVPHTVHGSGPNRSQMDRRCYVNGYVIAANCDRGEWAFRHGVPCELGEPVLVQYDDLYTRPEPHYIEGPLYPVFRS
jgi:ectoine hydroxylase-related dioxygenase (phytanoyl-CoA dioxygenase family)